MRSPAQGVFSRMYVKSGASPYTWDGSSETWEFFRGNPKKVGSIIDSPGIRGTRQKSKERARKGTSMIIGRPQFAVDPVWLDAWLTRIMGGTEVADLFSLAELLPSFGALFDLANTQLHEFKDAKVNSALFHAVATSPEQEAIPVDCTLEIFALTEALGTPAPNVSLATSDASAPYCCRDVTFNLQSAAREVKEVWLLINNHLQPRFVLGSETPVSLEPRDLTVSMQCRVPYDTDNDDLHDLPVAGAGGAMTWTNGGLNTIWTFGNLKAPANGPVIVGKMEGDLLVEFESRKSGSTPVLAVNNDSVP